MPQSALGPPTDDFNLIDKLSGNDSFASAPDLDLSKVWTDWLSHASALHYQLVCDSYVLGMVLMELAFVLFAWRRISCPLEIQQSGS